MGIAPRKFAGIETRIPGAYTKSNYITAPGDVGAVTNAVVVLGSALGGIPYNASEFSELSRVQEFSTLSQLQDVLRGGPGYYMSEFYLTPTDDENLGKPSRVLFVRVDPAARSVAKVRDVGDAVDVINLTSSRYGALANQLAFQLQAGTNIGHRVIVKFQGNNLVDRDDVGLSLFRIQNVGTATTATLTLTNTTLTIATDVPAEDLTVTLSDYPTLGELVAYLDEQSAYTCILLGGADESSAIADNLTTVDIKTSAVDVLAVVEGVIRLFNNEAEGEVVATINDPAVRPALLNNPSFVFFTAGTDGTVTNNNWIGALDLLKKVDINHILVASGDASIHALVKTHLNEMSSIVGRKNRSAGAGASTATNTFDARVLEMKALNSARFEYAVTPILRRDVFDGNQTKTWAPFYGSALTAGLRFGNFITAYSNFKVLNVVGVTENYERGEVERYIAAGATIFQLERRGVTVTHNVSTYQGSNLILNYPSVLRTADYITIDSQAKMIERMARMDRAPTAVMLSDLQNWVLTNLLPSYEQEGTLTRDFNTGAPAFDNVTMSVVGDTVYLRFRGILPVPLLFAFITQDFEIIGSRSVAEAA